MTTLEQPSQQAGPGRQGPHHPHSGISNSNSRNSRLGDHSDRSRAVGDSSSRSADGGDMHLRDRDNNRRITSGRRAVASTPPSNRSSLPSEANESAGAAYGSNVYNNAAAREGGNRSSSSSRQELEASGMAAPQATGRRHHRRLSSGSDSGSRGRPGSGGGIAGGDGVRGGSMIRSPRRVVHHPVKIAAVASPGLKRRSRTSAGGGGGGGSNSEGELGGSSDSSSTFSPSPSREPEGSASDVREGEPGRREVGSHTSTLARAVACSSTDGASRQNGASRPRSRRHSSGVVSRSSGTLSGRTIKRSNSVESNSLSPPPPARTPSAAGSAHTSLDGNYSGEESNDSLPSFNQRSTTSRRVEGGEGRDHTQASDQGNSLTYAGQSSPVGRAAAASSRRGASVAGELSAPHGNGATNSTVTMHMPQSGEYREWGERGERNGGEGREKDREIEQGERGGEGREHGDRRERGERSERRRPRSQSGEHGNTGDSRDSLMRVRNGRGGPPSGGGSSGGQPRSNRSGGVSEARERRSGNRERGPRAPGGHGQRRRAGARAMSRGRPAGRSGRGRRRSASMPGYRPGAIGGLAPVVEEEERDEDEEEEPDMVDPETIFRVVNKDTGQVVGDLRNETDPVPYDVLPAHFRPSQAWHPEHEEQALAAAASPLDLAGAEKHSRRAGARKGGSKAGNRIKSMLFRKPRDHKDLYDEHDGHPHRVSSRLHNFTDGFKGGGGVVGFSTPASNDDQQQAVPHSKDRVRSSDAIAAESASMAVSAVAWPKKSVSDPASVVVNTTAPSEAPSARSNAHLLAANDYAISVASSKASALLGVSPSPAMSVSMSAAVPDAETAVGGGGRGGSAAATTTISGGIHAAGGAGDRGTSPLPNEQSDPRTSPTSADRAPTRQEMAAAQVAKRKAALQGRGLMENAFLKATGTLPLGSPRSLSGTDSIATAASAGWNAALPGATPDGAARGLQPPPIVTAPEDLAAGSAEQRRLSASAVPDQSPWDAAILQSEHEGTKRRSLGRTPHKQHASHHHHGGGGQRQARASPTAVGAGVDPGHTHSHRATAAGAHSAPSNPGSDGNRGSSELHPLMRLTIDPKAGPTSGGTGGNKHLHRDHGEESPLPGGGRGGGAEPPLSPGFRVLADTDWDNQSTGSLVPGGTSVSSSPRISGALTPRGGGGGGGVEGVKTAAVVAASKVASLEAVKGMKLLQHFRAHTGAVSCAEFSRKGQYLATGGADGLVKIWQIGAPDEEMVVPPTRERGRGGGGGEVGQMPASAGPSLPPALERSDSDVSISSLSSMVSVATTAAGSTHDCQTAPLPVATGELVLGGRASRVLRGHNGDVVDLSWSPNAFLLSAGRDGSLRLWHPGKLGCVHLFPQTGPATPTSCAFHPRLENSFATTGEDGKIRVWKITSGKVESEAHLPVRATHVRFSPDGKALAAGMVGGHVRFLTSETLLPIAQLELRKSRKQGGGVYSIAFKPGANQRGEVLISGANGRLRLYRIEPLAGGQSAMAAAISSARKYGGSSGAGVTKVAKLKGHLNPGLPVRSSVTEDGRLAVCGSEDGLVHVWDASLDAEWGARGHVSFDGTTPIVTDNDREESLSPTAVAMIRSPSSSPRRSPAQANNRGSNNKNTSLGKTQPVAEAASAPSAAAHAGASASSKAGSDGRDSASPRGQATMPAAGAAVETMAADPEVGGGGGGTSGTRPTSKPRRRTPPGRNSPVARGRDVAAVAVARSGSSTTDNKGAGAAVTIAVFVPKVAMARFEAANGLTGHTLHSQNQALRQNRTASKTSQAHRRAGIPAIAEVVQGEERSIDSLWGGEEASTNRVSETSAKMDSGNIDGSGARRSTRYFNSSHQGHMDPDSGSARSSRDAARSDSSRTAVVFQRRGSANDAIPSTHDVSDSREGGGDDGGDESDRMSISPVAEGSRWTKKRRGSDGDQARASQTFSNIVSPSLPPPPVPGSAFAADSTSAGTRLAGSAGLGDASAYTVACEAMTPPPTYLEVASHSGDGTASSKSTSAAVEVQGRAQSHERQHHQQQVQALESPLTSPPPAYDAAARWEWTKENGSTSRGVHMPRRHHAQRGDGGQPREGMEEVAGGESREYAGAPGGADGSAGARVVHVDVYRPTSRADKDSSHGRDGCRSRRGSDQRRRMNHDPHPGLSVSSPSQSPTNSPLLTPPAAATALDSGDQSFVSPIVASARVRPGFSSAGGTAGAAAAARKDDSSTSGAWSWEGPTSLEITGGKSEVGTSRKQRAGNDGKGKGWGMAKGAIAANSLLVATDSLGYVRIYAKEALLEALAKSSSPTATAAAGSGSSGMGRYRPQ